MTALSGNRSNQPEKWTKRRLAAKVSTQFYKGQAVGFETTAGATQGQIVPMTTSTTLVYVGKAAEKLLTPSSGAYLDVELGDEIVLWGYANATAADAVAATDAGALCYFVDDQTVSITGTGKSVAGRVWYIDSDGKVWVQKLSGSTTVAATNIAASGVAPGTAYQTLRTKSDGTASEWGDPSYPAPTVDLPAFAANDSAPPTVVSGRCYSVPATGAASTVTLPAGAADGTSIRIVADGTNNGHTVQYRDATGPTNLTTALTASKRHHVVATKMGGKWFCNAYVSP